MNHDATIHLKHTEARFAPFDVLEGRVRWALEKGPKRVELRLCWFTQGRAEEESGIVATQALGQNAQGEAEFSFLLPDQPYSFSSDLLTLTWGLELVAEPIGAIATQEFTMAPGGKELLLSQIASAQTELKGWRKGLWFS